MFTLCVVGLVTCWMVLHTKGICDARSGFRLKLGPLTLKSLFTVDLSTWLIASGFISTRLHPTACKTTPVHLETRASGVISGFARVCYTSHRLDLLERLCYNFCCSSSLFSAVQYNTLYYFWNLHCNICIPWLFNLILIMCLF